MSRVIGNVKWYDTKKGYGFITLVTPDNESIGKDVFVHFSNVNVTDGYRRLFPGEYVEFELGVGKDGRSICSNVSGLYGGNLLCQNVDHQYRVSPKGRRGVGEGEDSGDAGSVSDDGGSGPDDKDC